MAFALADRVKETTTTTGTGTVSLSGAVTGFQTFVSGIGTTNICYYVIAGRGTSEWEVGTGTVTSGSPDTLSRTTVLSSSNAGALVSFSAGVKDVFCTLPADGVLLNQPATPGTVQPGNTNISGMMIAGGMTTTGFVSSPYSVVAPRPLVDATGTGALTSITTAIGSGADAYGVAVDPTGRFVYVANNGVATVSMFSINQSSGALTSLGTIASGTGPRNVAVDPTGRFAYVANNTTANVSMYSIDQITGALTSITTAIAASTGAWGITVDPTGRFVYVANNGVNTVSMYSIDQITGALTSITTAIGSGVGPWNIAVDPTCRFVYTANNLGNSVSVYSIDQTTGALTSTSAIAAGTNPAGVAVDPTGRFVYIGHSGDNTVSMFSIDQSSGALTSITTAITAVTAPRSVAVDPTGQFVYAANYGSANVSMFSINQSSGALTSITTAIATTANPRGITVDPTGRFVYVANAAGNVTMYSIMNFQLGSGSVGTLTAGALVGNATTATTAGALAPLTTYTPTWTTDGTAPSLGNGTVTGRYQQYGDMVFFSIVFTAGSTTTFGTGGWHFSLPNSTTPKQNQVVSATLIDANGNTSYSKNYPVQAELIVGSNALFFITALNDSYVTNAQPFTWTTNDGVTVTGWYEKN